MAWTDLILVTKTRKWVWWYINKLIENCEYLKGGGSARIGFLEGYFKNDTPAVWGDRLLLLVGQVVTISSYQDLCDAIYCGDADNATAPCFYKTSDAGGTTRSTSGTYMVMLDARGLPFKGLGNAIINGRTKVGPKEIGELLEDHFQEHWKELFYYYPSAVAAGGSFHSDNPGVASNLAAVQDRVRGSITAPGYSAPRLGDHTTDSSAGINWGIGY
jgi:hypothetical protein